MSFCCQYLRRRFEIAIRYTTKPKVTIYNNTLELTGRERTNAYQKPKLCRKRTEVLGVWWWSKCKAYSAVRVRVTTHFAYYFTLLDMKVSIRPAHAVSACKTRLSMPDATKASLDVFFSFNEQSPPWPLGARLVAHSSYYLCNTVINTRVKLVGSPDLKQRCVTCNARSCQSN